MLGVDEEGRFQTLDTELKIGPEDIVYVTGDSASGKSVLLNAIEKDIRQGMRKIIEQGPSEEAVKISKVLSEVGFNLQLRDSEKYVCSILYNLSPEQLSMVKEALAKYDNPRLRKELGDRHRPFGNTAAYVAAVQGADSAKLARVIRVVGMLLQTKVYLFWQKL
jgi:energy-coupling factor transporter ATP-binding protein EcfA2